jgi:hypothetical protein
MVYKLWEVPFMWDSREVQQSNLLFFFFHIQLFSSLDVRILTLALFLLPCSACVILQVIASART